MQGVHREEQGVLHTNGPFVLPSLLKVASISLQPFCKGKPAGHVNWNWGSVNHNGKYSCKTRERGALCSRADPLVLNVVVVVLFIVVVAFRIVVLFGFVPCCHRAVTSSRTVCVALSRLALNMEVFAISSLGGGASSIN